MQQQNQQAGLTISFCLVELRDSKRLDMPESLGLDRRIDLSHDEASALLWQDLAAKRRVSESLRAFGVPIDLVT